MSRVKKLCIFPRQTSGDLVTAAEIYKPIFIVGAARSGTSVLYRKLARQPDLAWISNITKKVPGSLLATRAIMLFRSDHKPTEAKKVWRKYMPVPTGADGRELATPGARRFLHRVVRNNLRLFGKTRFLSKDPSNSWRLEFLDEIFPDALYLHIIRDGRAVATSMLRMRERRGLSGDREALEEAASDWQLTINTIRKFAASLPAERYLEVRYESFSAAPDQTLEQIGRWCGLEWEPALLSATVSDVKSQDYKWRATLSAEDVEALESEIGDLLVSLGYEL